MHLRPRPPGQEGQVRVVRYLQDPVGHPRRAQEPGLDAGPRPRACPGGGEGHDQVDPEAQAPPTEAEIAAEVCMGVAEYRGFLDQHSRAQVASLEARLEDRPGSVEHGALLEDSSAVNPQSQANIEETRVQLVDAISQLEERERLVATFYFYEGLTLKEIGQALDLTEGRISQILRQALGKLRERLQGTPGGLARKPGLKAQKA